MIELVSTTRCTECNICVRICPMNVFDQVPGSAPVIARQDDCQTCFMCELYCPADALYVSPQAATAESVDETGLAASRLLGGYRDAIGWNRPVGQRGGGTDLTFRLLPPP
jgi:NAD-dependent dihydropyrimidine dehydrogenase PreA subunit